MSDLGNDAAGTGVDFAQRLVASGEVLVRPVGQESVLLDLASETYLGLDPVASRIWELLSPGATPESVLAPLLEEFEVDEARLRADVAAFVSDLLARGLIVAD
jgi:hypothetical protein